MSFNGSGTFQINTAGQPVVTGTTITSTAFNALTADLATGLSTCITKDGQTTPTANIPMGNNKITGMAAGTAATDAANLSQAQSTATKLLSVSGTDTITASGSPTVAAYSSGAMYYFSPANTNTSSVTINIDSLGAKAITKNGSNALIAGDLTAGRLAVIVYDGTQFQLVGTASLGNISISGNTITTTNSNGDLILDPNGTGVVLVNCTTSDWGAGSAAMEVKSDSSGKLYPIILESVQSGRGGIVWNQATTGDNAFWYFDTEASPTIRGSITYNRAGGSTAYNTTSDYRSKDVYGPVENSGAQLDALKVYRGKMHGATIERPVMLAHELAEVAKYAVNGEKDAVNEDGSPRYQQVDYSMMVPLLIAEIQSLRARVAALEAK